MEQSIQKWTKQNLWNAAFKNGPSKICGRQPLKNFTWFIYEYFVPYYESNVNF